MRKLICILILVVSIFELKAQELPPIQNYGITDYEAGNQNWSISQSGDKHIYFGNNNGLLEFNGATWKLYPSVNGTILRAVHAIDEIIYTGCYMEFGFWKRNEFGVLKYNSLVNKLNQPLIEDEHFWNITSRDEWVLFQSLNRVYIFNTVNETFEIIEFNSTRAKIFNLETGIFIQKDTGGLYSIQNGKAILISDHEVFRDNFIVGIYNHSKKLLIITENGKFYFLKDDDIVEWKIDALDFNQDINLYGSLQLRDGGIVLGAVSDGYIHLNENGKMVQRVNQERGLLNNTVLSAFQDIDGNLWLGLDNGISLVNLESAFSVYTDAKGKLGAVYASIVYKDHLYLGTNQGLFVRELSSADDFQLVKYTNGQVWNLQIIEGTLFCSHTNGTFVIDDKKARQIYDDSGTWNVLSINEEKNLLIQGNYNGLNVLEKSKGQWRFRNKIKGFNISSKSMAFIKDHQLVVNHEFKGLFGLKIDEDYMRIVDIVSNLPVGIDSNISTEGGRVLFASSQGLFSFSGDGLSLKKEDFLSSVFYAEEDRIRGKLILGNGDRKIWGFSEKNIVCIIADQFDGTPNVVKVPIPSFFRRNQGLTGFENLSRISEGRFLIGTSNGYSILDLDKVNEKSHEVKLLSIEKEFINAEDIRMPLTDNQVISYSENNLRFFFSVPQYDKFTEVTYQYHLKGLNDEWSKWFKHPEISFGNLPFGDYTLLIRAKIGNKRSDNTASYSFTIDKPWYFSNLAIFSFIVAIVLLMLLIHRSYKLYYKNQKKKLVEENRRIFEMTQLESEQKIMKLKNEQLRKDIESKNNELATAAMSLINKNELLMSIKNDLLHLDEGIQKAHVIKVIDKNLNNNKDWNFFKEAFNNADKDFLDKIKSLHPDLTANDLKFCAFLRLNLSSKEVAPLLNISIRSVEIKRYRLRKKLNLEHSQGLIDYILEI